jgi:type IV pilus assembly protein PilB
MAQMMRRDIGDVLVQGKVISPEQLAQAREVQSRQGRDLSDVLIQDQRVNPFHVLQATAHLHGMKAVDLTKMPPESNAINLIPPRVAQQFKCVPISRMSNNGQERLVVAVAEPSNVQAQDAVQQASKLSPQMVLAPREQIEELLAKHYPENAVAPSNGNGAAAEPLGGGADSIAKMVSEYGPATGAGDDDMPADESDLVQGPIIRIAHSVIQEAVKAGASDIHIEPSARNTRVRYRVDGVLHEVMQMPKHIHPPLISRYKIMAEMNIAERRVPQDSRIGINFQGKDYDLRVSCLPTINGEKIVMRILDKGNVMIGLNRLGFFPDTLSILETLITQPNGMFLATGPTGAGKSTTMYSVLNRVNSVERNIMTVEDPVEYQLPGVTQVAINRKAGLSFATALRSFMRQDPDIIMVGEIRDLETAELAIQASLTGHLVLSTLHTNDAPSSVTRLVDMGVEPFLVSATLIGALAQRLGRRICEKCKEEYSVPAEMLRPLRYPVDDPNEEVQLWRGRGCDNCRQTGYKGRIGIYELMKTNEEISELIVRRAPVAELTRAARANGMKTLQDDGLRKVLAGITTPEEVERVVFTAGH